MAVADFRSRIEIEADRAARGYLSDVENETTNSRELKLAIEGIIAADYEGRTVVELLQNAHDAHPDDRPDGTIAMRVDAGEGDAGVLYVANGGASIREEDFSSICRVAMSTKRPDEGIGNKGVGFKSVLHLSDSPEVYSAADPADPGFGGFSFRFARPSDFDEIASRVRPSARELADALRHNVSGLKVPIPIADVPPAVTNFRRRGFCTVIRLPLRTPEALQAAFRQMREIVTSAAPFHLFLDRVESITIEAVGMPDKLDFEHTLARKSDPVPGGDLVCLNGKEHFRLMRRGVPEARMREAIAASRAENSVSVGWEDWVGDGEVVIALPLEQPATEGRLYTYLPMGRAAAGPLPGYVNAPFFASLDRRSLQERIPVNSLLLDEVAALAAETLIGTAEGSPEGLRGDLAVDLASWTAPYLDRLRSALSERSRELSELPFVPDVKGRSGRLTLSSSWIWPSPHRVFVPSRLGRMSRRSIVSTSLSALRTTRLIALARDLGIEIVPDADVVADFAESCAVRMHRRRASPKQWRRFYDELAVEFPDSKPLGGKQIICTTSGIARANGGPKSSSPTVFLPPAGSGGAHLESGSALLADRIIFLSPLIPWGRRATSKYPGREWLLRSLVREYRSEAVLRVAGDLMSESGRSDDQQWAVLNYAFTLWSSTRTELGPEVLQRARLRIRTRAGWVPAGSALFGRGWGGQTQAVDIALTRFTSAAASASPEVASIADRLVSDDTMRHLSVETAGADQLRTFLESAGVVHGLPLIDVVVPEHIQISGSAVQAPRSDTHFPVPGLDHETSRRWKTLAATWPRVQASYPSVGYSLTDLTKFPGQQDWSSFDHDTRLDYATLIVHGLATWPENALRATFRRSTDHRRPEWPSLGALFLVETDWVPQSTPDERAEVVLRRPTEAWWVETTSPNYLPRQPPRLGQLNSEVLATRLRRVGVRLWDRAESAPSRIAHLNQLVCDQGRPPPGVVRALDAAWADLLATATDPDDYPDILATRAGRYETLQVAADGETVYVSERADPTRDQLVSQAPVPQVAIRDKDAAGRFLRRCEDAGWRRFVPIDRAKAGVVVDGRHIDELDAELLTNRLGSWIRLLALGVMDHVYSRIPRISAEQLQEASGRVEHGRITIAESYEITIGGHSLVVDRPGRSFLGTAANGDRIVVVIADSYGGVVGTAEQAHAALAELAGATVIEQDLREKLFDLMKLCPDRTPTEDEVIAVLGIDQHELDHLDRGRFGVGSDFSSLIGVLGWVDPDLAESFRAATDELLDEPAVMKWLDTHLVELDIDPNDVMRANEADEAIDGIRLLGVTLAHANAGLRHLGLSPVSNPRGHALQFASFLDNHRSMLVDELRDRFAPTIDRNLDAYLSLRDLAGLTPNTDWLVSHWDLDADLMFDHVLEWLDQVKPRPTDSESVDLPPVDELREMARRTFPRVIPRTRLLIDAWLHEHEVADPPLPIDYAAAHAAFSASGLVDFGRTRAADIVAWLSANRYWPQGMPTSTALADLNLTEADLAAARQRMAVAAEHERRTNEQIAFSGEHFTDQDEDIRKLTEAVWDSVDPDTAPAPFEITVLPRMTIPENDDPPSSGQPGSRSTTWRSSEHKTTLIGLAGEAFVADWILKTFGVPPEVSWKSGYRGAALGSAGNDSLGYDFLVRQETRNLLIEVKSTTGDDAQFSLGETEVRRARHLGPDEEYVIAFVTHVLNPEHRQVRILPNPLSSSGIAAYRILGRAIRFQFDANLGQISPK